MTTRLSPPQSRAEQMRYAHWTAIFFSRPSLTIAGSKASKSWPILSYSLDSENAPSGRPIESRYQARERRSDRPREISNRTSGRSPSHGNWSLPTTVDCRCRSTSQSRQESPCHRMLRTTRAHRFGRWASSFSCRNHGNPGSPSVSWDYDRPRPGILRWSDEGIVGEQGASDFRFSGIRVHI